MRVGEGQEAVQECGGGGGAQCGVGFGRRSASPTTGMERGEVGEVCGWGGGGAAGVGGGPGMDCAGGGLEVHEQRVGAAGREAVRAHVAELFIHGGGARLAEWEGDRAVEGRRHCPLEWVVDARCVACFVASARCGERGRRGRRGAI